MTEEQKQEIIKESEREIERISSILNAGGVASGWANTYRKEITRHQIVLAALKMPPAVTGEHLDLIAAHREVADLKEQLAKSEAKFQNMLEAEHRLSDAYIRIREIVGTINLPEGADVWQATEAAAAKLVAMTGQPVKQPQTHDAHGFPEPAHILNSRWIEAIRAAGHEVQE